jgi:hypothetical protein
VVRKPIMLLETPCTACCDVPCFVCYSRVLQLLRISHYTHAVRHCVHVRTLYPAKVYHFGQWFYREISTVGRSNIYNFRSLKYKFSAKEIRYICPDDCRHFTHAATFEVVPSDVKAKYTYNHFRYESDNRLMLSTSSITAKDKIT